MIGAGVKLLSQADIDAIAEAVALKLKSANTVKRFLNSEETAEYLGIKRTTLRNLEASPDFPKPINRGGTEKRRTHPRWDIKDLEKYAQSRKGK